MLPSSFLSVPLAHRALHDVADGRPENSRAAIRAAMDAGYGIEIDLQLSKDGQAMVFHDYMLDRLTHERGPVRGRTAAELGQIVLDGGNEGIPTFAEVLDLVAGRVPLLVELKDQDGAMGDNLGPLEEASAAAVQNYEGPLAFMSFNPNSVARLACLAPDVPRGLVTDGYKAENWALLPENTRTHLRDIPDFDRTGACFISHGVNDLNRPRVAEIKATGAPILCWTVRSPEQEAEARRIADNITFEGYLAAFTA
ncbi:glycerophosphodiester phosphodiesterase family protein [Shimia sediminis]|uniref:glycerophosphodiester phosphodiesterase family protein n=1 Tax=Shimia sediminis TaxID=2497945 RepID=UPI000F8DA4D4|nr:glycerophosphodiester phosphodiesterase family protein [Shimia sediminis]